MAKKIKVYTNYNEYNDVLTYQYFTIVEGVYEVGDLYDGEEIMVIEPVKTDIASNNIRDFELYDYYRVETTCNGEYKTEDEDCCEYYLAMPKPEVFISVFDEANKAMENCETYGQTPEEAYEACIMGEYYKFYGDNALIDDFEEYANELEIFANMNCIYDIYEAIKKQGSR